MSVSFLNELRGGTAPEFVPITVEQYQQMIESGILLDGDPIELIDGLLVRKDRSACGDSMITHHPRHALLIKRLNRLLMAALNSGLSHVQNQLPVTLSTMSVPEPDIAVVRGNEADYADRHPGPDDLSLVIEVSGSSLRTDRSTKQRLYATAGIPTYWIVNLAETQVETYELPDAVLGCYSQQFIYKPGQFVLWNDSPQQFIKIDVADLFS